MNALNLLSSCELFSDLETSNLTPFELETLAGELEIVRLKRGEILMKQGGPSDCMYVVVSGRLEVVVEGADGERILIGELRSSETVGELGLIDGSPRMATVVASRDSLLVKVSPFGFNRLVRSNADSLIRIARAGAARMRTMGQRRFPLATVCTIAIVGDLQRPEFQRFTSAFCAALRSTASVLYLSPSPLGEKFHEELAAGENTNRFVVFAVAAEPTPATLDHLRQTDRILMVHAASEPQDLQPIERAISEEHKAGRMPVTELVLLHDSDARVFPGSSKWLTPRTLLRHHHVRRGVPGDAGRIARLIAGRAIGLVLGGGGARGFAHIGVMRAIAEADFPIDMIGGVSMGSIIAGLFGMGYQWQEILVMTKREMTRRMTSVTLPIVSLSTGNRFRRVMNSFFGETEIEDLGLSFFCTSCDLSTGEMVVHRSGSLAKAIGASNAIPVVFPPVLSGGHMLIDGGILNNQPGDVMKRLCGGQVVVTNVSPRREATVDTSLIEMPSAWRILRSRLNPFEPTIRVPGISVTMMRTLMVASERKSREVEVISDFYLRPPIDQFRVDDFGRIEEIAEAGYLYAREEIQCWKANRKSALDRDIQGPTDSVVEQ